MVLSTEKSALRYVSSCVLNNSESYTKTRWCIKGPAVRRLTSSATWNLHTRFFLLLTSSPQSLETKKSLRFLIRFSRNFLISHFFLFFTLIAYFYVDCIAQESQFVFNICAVKMWKILLKRKIKRKKFPEKKDHEALWTVEENFSYCFNGF